VTLDDKAYYVDGNRLIAFKGLIYGARGWRNRLKSQKFACGTSSQYSCWVDANELYRQVPCIKCTRACNRDVTQSDLSPYYYRIRAIFVSIEKSCLPEQVRQQIRNAQSFAYPIFYESFSTRSSLCQLLLYSRYTIIFHEDEISRYKDDDRV